MKNYQTTPLSPFETYQSAQFVGIGTNNELLSVFFKKTEEKLVAMFSSDHKFFTLTNVAIKPKTTGEVDNEPTKTVSIDATKSKVSNFVNF